eukprot:2422888-Rhodomonas_salina.1
MRASSGVPVTRWRVQPCGRRGGSSRQWAGGPTPRADVSALANNLQRPHLYFVEGTPEIGSKHPLLAHWLYRDPDFSHEVSHTMQHGLANEAAWKSAQQGTRVGQIRRHVRKDRGMRSEGSTGSECVHELGGAARGGCQKPLLWSACREVP